MPTIKIGKKTIGKDNPCFIILEAGINHNGNLKLAKEMVEVAVKAGADAIKFQIFTAEKTVADKNLIYTYKTQGKQVTESMIEMFKKCEFNEKQWQELRDFCVQKKIIFFAAPQDIENLEVLLKIGVNLIKVGSDDLVNLPLLENYAKRKIPMIISTGMAYLSEVDEAVRVIKKYNKDLVLLHCNSLYPVEPKDLNMNKMKTLQLAFPDCVIGFSDHSNDLTASILAVGLGSKILERHFTLSHDLKGPDHWFSLDKNEAKEWVSMIRKAEQALGLSAIKPCSGEIAMRALSHRSLTASHLIKKGEKLTKENTTFKKPGTGIASRYLSCVLNRKAKEDIQENALIKFKDLL